MKGKTGTKQAQTRGTWQARIIRHEGENSHEISSDQWYMAGKIYSSRGGKQAQNKLRHFFNRNRVHTLSHRT